jgi:hypothetical protein
MLVKFKRKHQWKINNIGKRGKETYTGRVTLIYILQTIQSIKERDPERKISSRETYPQGEKPQEEIPFSIDVKGGEIETLMRSDDHKGRMSMSISMHKCCHECWCFHMM